MVDTAVAAGKATYSPKCLLAMVSTDRLPYISACPHGCKAGLVDSDILMPEGPLKSCPACGQLISQCSEAVYLETSRYWDESDGTWPNEKDMRRLTRRRTRTLKTVSRILKMESGAISLLDIGCSSGAFVWIAKQRGIDAQGVEPGEIPARRAHARGLKVHIGYLDDLTFPDKSFDVITLFEVIEHIKQPLALLNECRRILRPGGVMVIGTGNTDSWTCRMMKARWDFFDISLHGGHINFYSTASINALAAKTGFAVSRIRTSSVNIYEKSEVPAPLYRVAKIAAELLNFPSRILNKGHQMEAFLVAN